MLWVISLTILGVVVEDRWRVRNYMSSELVEEVEDCGDLLPGRFCNA